MIFTDTEIPDVKIIEPTEFIDERGYFFESFNHKIFQEKIGREVTFVQDNHSKSNKGVIRGLHYQLPPFAQGKLVRVVQGQVFDVAVDIRASSPSFGQWVGETLSAKNKKQLWIPEGFAHGFLAIDDRSEVLYKTTDYYKLSHSRELLWNDPDIDIDWPIDFDPLLSSRDRNAIKFKEVFWD